MSTIQESNDGISWTAQAGIFDLDTDLHVDAFKNGSSQDLSKNSPFLLKELTDEGRQYYVSPASCAVDNTVSKSEQPFDVTSFGFATSTKIESEPETPGEAPTVVSNSFERATVTPSPQLFMPKLLSPPPRAVIFPAFSPQSYVYQYLPMLTQPAIVPFLVPQQQQQQQSGMAYWKEDKQVDAAAIVPDTPYKSDGDSVAESLPALQDPVVTPDRNKYFRGRELFPPLKKQEARQHKRRMSEKWWEAMYEKAKKYREIHGHCWIPQRDPKHPQDDDDLRRWARTQRGYYNRLKGGRHDAGEGDVLDNCDFESITEGGLTLDRMERLRKIGFVFEYHSLSWWKNHEEVTKFKKSTGHTRVPAKYESSPALGTWVRTQRRLYLAGKLAADRIEALHRIKFEFHLRPRRSEKSRRKGGA